MDNNVDYTFHKNALIAELESLERMIYRMQNDDGTLFYGRRGKEYASYQRRTREIKRELEKLK